MTGSDESGFTGRVWEAVPAARLAAELTTGPGVAPMAEAGVAFGQLATGLDEATTELRAALIVLGQVWRSPSGEAVVQRAGALANWFEDTARTVGETGRRAAAQAAAYEAAALAMPGADERAVLHALNTALTPGAVPGSALIGSAADLEDRAHTIGSLAAEAMRGYETATTPLAQPWPQQSPPVLSTEAALRGERALGGDRENAS
ncbi:PPE domain-containing protein [Nocardia alni]|uniref:PPE domain-containing protein n=1 Tax=Nocardia alni TaxID=2815723 RepID=UPI001C24656E|nr:PPE domain-containing protein [Nocardia alni]